MTLAMAAAQCLGQTAVSVNQQRETALALEQQGKNAEAEAAWRLYLKAHPSSPEPYAHLGLIEARQEHYKEAVPLYRKALALGPKLPSLQLNLGLALFKGGEMKQSIEVFGPLIESQPANTPQAQQLTILVGMAHYGESAEADLLAGEVLDETKDSAGAIQQFRAAVKADPKAPDVHFALGYALWTQNLYAEAASEFQAELANNPNHIQAMIYLGDTEMQLSHPEAAAPLLESSLRIDTGRELAHLDLGILYNDAGRRDDALRELKIAEQLSPNDENVHWRLGRFYQAAGRKEEAKAEFDTTRSLQKAVEDSLAKRLQEAQEKAKQASQAPDAPAAK